MNKEIVILTKSKMYKNYCVAGLDTTTGEWIRLCSQDGTIHNAVPQKDLYYKDRSHVQILDVVSVELLCQSPNHFQPENYTYDPLYYWTRTGRLDTQQVWELAQKAKHHDKFIFHNCEKKLPESFVKAIPEASRYSLKLVNPDWFTVEAKRWDPGADLRYTACLTVNGRTYNYLNITDQAYIQRFPAEGRYNVLNVICVVSLGQLFDKDDHHYKLVASVLDL